MVVSKSFCIPAAILTVLILIVSCGKDTSKPEADPYKNLSRFRWVSRNYVTEDGQKIEVTTTFKFNEEKTYSMSQKGVLDGDEIESYQMEESGTYELNGDSMTVTPSNGDPYTMSWQVMTGSGNLQLEMPDGRTLEFEYTVPQGWGS